MEHDTGRTAKKPSAFPGIFPWLALAAIAAIGMALQWRGIAGAFLGDDFSHLDVISRFAGRSELWSWTLARFYEPLGNGTFAYRPLAFASYALDWLTHRDNAAGWRITSLTLYSLNALAAGMLAGRWLSGRSPHAVFGAMVGGSTLFAYPFAGEVSYWLAGRFDLLACLFSLLFLLALPLFRRSTPGQHLWRLAWLLCALLSKESAAPLPLVATLLVFACAATGNESGRFNLRRGVHWAMAELWPAWFTLGAYLLWRLWLFGSVLQVYPTLALTRDPFELVQRLAGLEAIARGNVGAHFATWACAAVLAILAILFLCIRARSSIPKQLLALMFALLVCAMLYLVAPALSFPVSSADGEGARHFYIAWAYAALLLGMLAAWHRAQWPFGVALVALMVAGQAQSLSQWHAAGRQMTAVAAGVDRLAADIGEDQYALLLLPDHIGVAMFARAAQDAIVMPPTQRRNYLPRMAVMVSTDFAEWSSYIKGGKIAEIKGLSGFDSANFVGLYCWNATRSAFVPLTSGSVAADATLWLATARKNFPQAGCITPF